MPSKQLKHSLVVATSLSTSPLRSTIMRAVPRRNTAPELALRRALFSCGLRFRVGASTKLPGTPDVVFPGSKVAVFVDGCFWHGCPIHGTQPRSNAAFWRAKLDRNRQRDLRVDEALLQMGWIAHRVWEHELKEDTAAVAIRIWELVRSREL